MLGECTVRNYSIQAIMRSFRKVKITKQKKKINKNFQKTSVL